MELLEALAQTFDHAAKVVAGVRPDQLDYPTPCRDWDVRALVAHTMGVVMNMGRGASGADLSRTSTRFRSTSTSVLSFVTRRTGRSPRGPLAGWRARSTSARDGCPHRSASASTC